MKKNATKLLLLFTVIAFSKATFTPEVAGARTTSFLTAIPMMPPDSVLPLVTIVDTPETLQQPKPTTNVPNSQLFNFIDVTAKYKGGQSALMRYISTHIHYPEDARREGVQGRIVIKFCVNEKGYVDKHSVMVIKGIGNEMDQEVIRVIKTLPRFEPAKNHGHPVRSYFTVPVTFSLNN